MPTVLVTGANRGLGLMFVQQYAQDGWDIIACCRNPDEAQQLNQAVDKYKNIAIHALDMASAESITQLGEKLDGQPIDVLINNAGTGGITGIQFGQMDYANYQQCFAINSTGPIILADALLENIRRGELKKIATITSRMGSIGDTDTGRSYAYRASKAAVNSLMKTAAVALKDESITVLLFHPGWVQTDMGGSQATLTIEESVQYLRDLIASSQLSDSGTFRNYLGETLPW